jgi:hypothetical protein
MKHRVINRRFFGILPTSIRRSDKKLKICRVMLNLLIIIISARIIQPLPVAYAVETELETSVVTLLLKSGENTIEKNPFFELLDLQSYVLLPLNKLASRLEIDFIYQREENILLLKAAKLNRQVRIDLNKRVYSADGERLWADQPPLALANDFYLTPLLFEYLSAVKIEWNFQYQELVIDGNWLVMTTRAYAIGPSAPTDSETVTYYREGPSCSLGAIRYELNWEYREDELGQVTSESSLNLHGAGRLGPWSISLGGEVTFEKGKEKTLDLSLIRAKYDDQNKLIVIGDSDLYLEETSEEQYLRGILIASSQNAFSRRLIPYTTIAGPAEPGDKVTLYLNGKAFNESIVAFGQAGYQFSDVPLKVKRLNIIKIIIEKPSGECLVTEETVASSLKILDPGTDEWMVACGYYRQDNSEKWEKKLAVFKSKQNIGNKLYLNSEILRTQEYDSANAELPLYSVTNNIAFILGQNTIYSLEWLVGGVEDELAQGWTAEALYCLENAYIEGIIFNVDPTITEDADVRTDPGKGFQFLGEWESNDRTTYQAQVLLINPVNLAQMPEYVARYGELQLQHRHGATAQHLFTIGASNEIEIDDSQTVETTQLYAQQRIYNKHSSSRNYLAGDYIETVESNGSGGAARAIEYEIDYLKSYGDSAFYNFSGEAVLRSGYANYTQIELDTGFKWFNPKRLASVYAETKFFKSDSVYNATTGDYHTLVAVDSSVLGFWHKYFWNAEWSLYTGYEWNYLDRTNHYTTATINLTRNLQDNVGQYYAKYTYTSPYDTRTTPQHFYTIGLEHQLKNGLTIKFEAEKIYETILSNRAERVFSFTCCQAIGLNRKRSKTIATDADDDDENLSFVSGVVYLDENGNSQWDKNEKILPEIRMSLNGRRAVTNKKGEYLYQYVEPDCYKLYFDLRSLPADYTPISDAILFKLKENENMFFDFGVTLNGSITGRLFLDQNGNRTYDESDHPLDWVAVVLDQGRKKVFTEADGSFYFENVPLGGHTVKVQVESLPKDLIIVGPSSFDRLIKENALDIGDINIPVVYKFTQ